MLNEVFDPVSISSIMTCSECGPDCPPCSSGTATFVRPSSNSCVHASLNPFGVTTRLPSAESTSVQPWSSPQPLSGPVTS